MNRLRIKAEQCETCIFRPGNPMNLRPGRVKEMVDACKPDGYIICHETLSDDAPELDDDGQRPMMDDEAICRGFLDAGHRPTLVQVAERLGLTEPV